MKTKEIQELFKQFEAVAHELNGIECWSARELQELLGYSNWQNFENVLIKAQNACIQAGGKIEDHFTDVSKMIKTGKGAEKQIDDILLTRYSCYLFAQNGDSQKP